MASASSGFVRALALSFAAAACIVLRLVACGGAQFVAEADGGSPPTDAGSSAQPFCAGFDGFCSDFDDAALPEQWSNVNSTGGATGVEDDDASVSPPNSYFAATPSFPTGDGGFTASARAVLTKVSLQKGESHVAFDMRIDALSFPDPTSLTASVITVAYEQLDALSHDGGVAYTLALDFHPGGSQSAFGAALLEISTGTLTGTTTKLDDLGTAFTQLGLWYHVSLDFGLDTADAGVVPASITVSSSAGTTTKAILLSPPPIATGGARSLSVGAQATAPVGAAAVRFDNVTYR
jgi:hypothetical protein